MKIINKSKLIVRLRECGNSATVNVENSLKKCSYGKAEYFKGERNAFYSFANMLEEGYLEDIYDEMPDEPQKDEFIELHELEDTANHIGEMAMFGIDSDYSKAVSLILSGYRPSKEGYHFISCDPRTGNILTWKHCKVYKPF